MKPVSLKLKYVVACAVAGLVAADPAMADKPAWAGSGKDNGGKDQRMDQRDDDRGNKGNKGNKKEKAQKGDDRPSAEHRQYFEPKHQALVRDYYGGEQFSGRRCPPGLAKKNNGCMPPGQAKKWKVGYPLPRDVIYYTVPQPLVLQIGPPPSGHRYVRVAGDILMIAIGTGMVVDAIQDLGMLSK